MTDLDIYPELDDHTAEVLEPLREMWRDEERPVDLDPDEYRDEVA